MSFAPTQSVNASDLLDLARTAPAGDRSTLYHKIASLFQDNGASMNSQERLLLLEIMGRLTRQVEMDLRMRLAESLADEPDANHDLILLLANDAIEVATPLILKSQALTEGDLIALVGCQGEQHQVTVAQRENITSPISRELFETGREAVLCALAANASAQIDFSVMEGLTLKSSELAALQGPLAARPDLPPALAERMYGWVSEALKAHLTSNFGLDPATLDQQLKDGVRAELKEGTRSNPRLDQYVKLIDKLHATGQLKPTYLIKALREGQREMFELALAKLLNISLGQVEGLLASPDLTRLALATRAAGVDRSAFGTIAVALHGKETVMGADAAQKAAVQDALKVDTPEEARRKLLH